MKYVRRLGRSGVIALILLWSVFPVYWALNTSLTTQKAAESSPAHYLPHPLTVTSYQQLFGGTELSSSISGQFLRSLLNAIIEAGGATLLTIPVALLAAYALARLRMRFRRTIFTAVLVTLLLPAYATLLPVYRIMIQLHLVNTYLGVILVYAAGFLPLAVWILYNYVLTIPRDLTEASVVDGASALETLRMVILPLAAPGVAAAAIITYLFGWAQFVFPLILTTGNSASPVTVLVAGISGERVVPFTLLMAAALLAAAPAGLIALALNRHIVSGLTAGGVK
jgi:multiple sugar transport system permease protein